MTLSHAGWPALTCSAAVSVRRNITSVNWSARQLVYICFRHAVYSMYITSVKQTVNGRTIIHLEVVQDM